MKEQEHSLGVCESLSIWGFLLLCCDLERENKILNYLNVSHKALFITHSVRHIELKFIVLHFMAVNFKINRHITPLQMFKFNIICTYVLRHIFNVLNVSTVIISFMIGSLSKRA